MSRAASTTDATGDAEPLTPPFTIVIDTREQQPFGFLGLRSDACQQRRPLVVPTIRGTLGQGDYSILGMEDDCAIERKSAQDLFGTLGQGRERFVAELERLAWVAAGAGSLAAVVVEAEWSEVFARPPAFSQLTPKIVFRSIVAWQQRYQRVHWWMMPDRRAAEIMTFRVLERFWKEAQK